MVGDREQKGRRFEVRGINHLALVCRDMAATVAFYEGVLGMPLIKTIELGGGAGQHFFFDCGNGNSVAFFWFPDAPLAAPGVSMPADRPDRGAIHSAHGSMNHVAFTVDEADLEACLERLRAAGVPAFPMVVNHDDSEMGVARKLHPGVFVRSVYFTDPNGIMMELAAFTRPFGPQDVRHEPASAPAEAVDA